MFDDNLCLIVFAKVFPILVKKVLKRDDIDCEFLVSTLFLLSRTRNIWICIHVLGTDQTDIV